MKSYSSYITVVATFGLFWLCGANKNIPPPFKGFGYRLFTKHPAPGTNQKGEFNFVHLSLPHPQFPVFEPFPDILTPLFPPVNPPTFDGPGKGRPGWVGSKGSSSGSTGHGASGSGSTGHGASGSGSTGHGSGSTGHGSSDSPTGQGGHGTSTGHGGSGTSKGQGGHGTSMGQGGSGTSTGQGGSGTSMGQGESSTSTGHGGSGTSMGQGGSGTSMGQGESGTSNGDAGSTGQSGHGDGTSPIEGQDHESGHETHNPAPEDTIGNEEHDTPVDQGQTSDPSNDGYNPDESYPAPEDNVITEDQDPFVPGTNGPTGGGTNGNPGSGVPIDVTAPICLYKNYTGLTLCTNDPDYPSVELKAYIQARYSTFMTMYADIASLNTPTSVDGLNSAHQETYICETTNRYWKPLRAKNSDGVWKIIVNVEQFTQTVRIETCTNVGKACSMVPPCFPTSCVQKHVYHRMLTFDPWNHYYPFKIDLFKIPSACSCLIRSPRYEP